MKHFILIVAGILVWFSLPAQSPQGFRYSAVVRDTDGNPLAEQEVTLRIGIRNETANGPVLYQETWQVTTNAFGLVNLAVGNGIAFSGIFEDIPWAEGLKFLEIEIDPEGGENYHLMGTSQLLSVPYALHAEESDAWATEGNNLSATNSGSVNIGASQPEASAKLNIGSNNSGFLPPRVTDTTAIENPAEGLMIYDLQSHCMRYFNGAIWSDCMGGIVAGYRCGDPLVDARDGRSYETVMIGTRCWMVENLNFGTMLTGGTSSSQNGTVEKYCLNNLEANCEIWGGLYWGNEMMAYNPEPGSQGICPDGWHIPTDDEWCELENFADTGSIVCNTLGWKGVDAGLKLKSLSMWTGTGNGTDRFGFTAIPAGSSHLDGSFNSLGYQAYFWTSTREGMSSYIIHNLGHNQNAVNRSYRNQNDPGLSVRCVKN